MEAYREDRGTALLSLNLALHGSGQFHAPAALLLGSNLSTLLIRWAGIAQSV